MRFSWPFYVAVVVIGSVSFFVGKWLPTEFLQNLAGMPLIGALAAALFQVIRDQLHHEDALALQRDQQHFHLGVTSHMANIAFDKHVEFCERYIKALQVGLSEMWALGPSPQCIKLSSELADIRLSYRAWIVFNLDHEILEFESALRKVGGIATLYNDMEHGESRTRKIEEMYGIFEQITALPRKGEKIDEELAAGRIMDYLQDLIGAKELAQLRSTMIKDAIKTLGKSH